MGDDSTNLHGYLHEFLKYLKNQNSVSDLTIKAYRIDLNQAFEILQPEKEPTPTRTHAAVPVEPASKLSMNPSSGELIKLARQAQNHWATLSLASRNRKTAALKSFFNWLYTTKKIDRPIAEQLQSPKVPKKIPHFISVDEALSVVDHYLKSENQNEPRQLQFALFCLLYGGGLRISEACSLKWSQITFETRSVRITGKGNKERICLLPEFCMNQLVALKGRGLETYVFGDKPLNPRTGYGWIREMGQRVGLMNALHPHSLRHSFATHMLSSGANLRTLQKILGHESLTATEKYTHLNVDQIARIMESKHPLSKKVTRNE